MPYSGELPACAVLSQLANIARLPIQRVCAPWHALNTKPPGATLSLLRLGTGLELLPKPFIAAQFTLRNSGIFIFSGHLTPGAVAARRGRFAHGVPPRMNSHHSHHHWLQRWHDNAIGWHHEEFNPCLLRFWRQLQVPTETRVLVPLCGKSCDMVWLAEAGHSVLGVELSPVATAAFSPTRDWIRSGSPRAASSAGMPDPTRYSAATYSRSVATS